MAAKKGNVLSVTAEYLQVCHDLKNLEKQKKVLADSLLLLIPEGEVVGGVKHIVEEKGVPSWKVVADRIVRELVPASRQQLVEPIIEACTGKPREYVRAVEE